MVGEAAVELPEDPRPALHLPQKETTPIRGDIATVKSGHHLAAKKSVKRKAFLDTLCGHRAVSSIRRKDLLANPLCLKETARSIFLREIRAGDPPQRGNKSFELSKRR
jgi:hypothetical protein